MTQLKHAALATLAVVALGTAPAQAAPVTVDLRIEGASRTLFEGRVTTDVRPFRFSGETTEHTCDGTAANSGPSGSPVPTSGAALATAAEQAPFPIRGTWSGTFGNPTFSEVAGEDVAYDAATGRFLAEYHNEGFAQYGSCGQPIADGDRVLYAYATGSESLLRLSGPAAARPGEAVTLTVTDASGAPVAGATVAGRPTGADGRVALTPTNRGDNDFKAERSGAIRSNRVRVCVSDGSDGLCGSQRPAAAGPAPASAPPAVVRGRITAIADGQAFRRGRVPRLLRGTVPAAGAGVERLRLRLTRNDRGRCFTFDDDSERQRRVGRCGAPRGEWFAIGDRGAWEYQLPFSLPRGRWVLDLEVRDRAGRLSRLERGNTRVVFTVR